MSTSPAGGSISVPSTIKPAARAERQTLVEAAESLTPVLRERAAEANQLRRLPDATWKDLLTAGLLRGLQPARWGGGEVHPKEFYSAVMEVARAEGCAGWVAGIIGVHPWQAALYPKEAQEEMWSADATAMNSSSYTSTGKVEKVPGGYRLSGRWSFSSGCDHCAWVAIGNVAGMTTVNGRDVPDFRSFLLPRKDYRIDDNWHVAGLAGTGSKDIVIDGAFVPDYRSQCHWDYTLGRPLPGWDLNPSPLYRLPFAIVFISTLRACVLGAALGFLEAWTELSATRKVFGSNITEDPYLQKLLSEASYTIKSSILRLHQDCDEMMEMARSGEPFTLKRRAELRHNAAYSAQLAARSVESLFEASGGHALFLDHPLQRRYQDIKAMRAHQGLNSNLPAKLYGAASFDLPILDVFL